MTEPSLKSGDEPLTHEGEALRGLTLLDFWRWSASDVLCNTTRGMLAEYLVAVALGVDRTPRMEWDRVDLRWEGIEVEVKSAAYLQSWSQRRLSCITFGVPPTRGWDARTNTYGSTVRRQADVYVFAILATRDRRCVNPLSLDQWEFHVCPTRLIDATLGTAKTVGIKRILELSGGPCPYLDLPLGIRRSTSCESHEAPG
jgi:hypothetical protein